MVTGSITDSSTVSVASISSIIPSRFSIAIGLLVDVFNWLIDTRVGNSVQQGKHFAPVGSCLGRPCARVSRELAGAF
jgi:hypothetical protein